MHDPLEALQRECRLALWLQPRLDADLQTIVVAMPRWICCTCRRCDGWSRRRNRRSAADARLQTRTTASSARDRRRRRHRQPIVGREIPSHAAKMRREPWLEYAQRFTKKPFRRSCRTLTDSLRQQRHDGLAHRGINVRDVHQVPGARIRLARDAHNHLAVQAKPHHAREAGKRIESPLGRDWGMRNAGATGGEINGKSNRSCQRDVRSKGGRRRARDIMKCRSFRGISHICRHLHQASPNPRFMGEMPCTGTLPCYIWSWPRSNCARFARCIAATEHAASVIAIISHAWPDSP